MKTRTHSLTDIFGTDVPMIGMVHLAPLPGTPYYDAAGGFEAIVDRALRDADRLVEGGIDGIQIENQFDRPFMKADGLGPETVAYVTAAAIEIRRRVDVPIGINIHLNGAEQALAIAGAVGASWIRVFSMASAYISTSGYVEGSGPSLMRYRRAIDAERVMLMGDFHVKHGSHAIIADRPIEEQAADAEEAGADAVLATGFKTGRPPQADDIIRVRKLVSVPILVGSGFSVKNAEELLPHIDGAIVGSSLKESGNIWNPVDPARVRELMSEVARVRTQHRTQG